MLYKKKLAILSALVVVLALVYILSFVLDPANRRSEAFAWLDPSLVDKADRIEIKGTAGSVVLIRRNNIWLSPAGTSEYPVKQSMVGDFINVLTRRSIYPLRAVSSEGRDKLGLGADSASRIIVRGGAGLPLLDLMVGASDALGSGVYLKRADKDEIYSGEDQFTLYTESKPASWYDLRLFPSGNKAAEFSIADVQQAELAVPENTFTLRRGNGGWIMVQNGSAALDAIKVEAWLRSVSEAEGNDFAPQAPPAADPASSGGTITLWLGDGTKRILQIGPGMSPDDGRRYAVVSNSSLTYVLSESTVRSLLGLALFDNENAKKL